MDRVLLGLLAFMCVIATPGPRGLYLEPTSRPRLRGGIELPLTTFASDVEITSVRPLHFPWSTNTTASTLRNLVASDFPRLALNYNVNVASS